MRQVCTDFENSGLDEKHKSLFRFLVKVNEDSPRISRSDIEELHQAGWTDEAIYFAVTVCALFHFYNRWIDATGVHPISDEATGAGAKRMAQTGYVR